MTVSPVRIGNAVIDAIEAMSDDISPKIMNKDLDLVEEAMDDADTATLRLFEKFLGYNWQPENRYVPLTDIQRVCDELYDHGVQDAEELITVERLNAFHLTATKLVRFGYKKWSDAAILAVLHPDDVSLLTALVIDRGIQEWDALERAVAAIKGLDSGNARAAA